MELSLSSMHSSLLVEQQDFEILDIEYTACSISEETASVSSEDGTAARASCRSAAHITEAHVTECASPFESIKMDYIEQDGMVCTRPNSGAEFPSRPNAVEPMRRLRPSSGPAERPKRFFRTFWRGLSMRAVSAEQHRTCMNNELV